MSDISNIDCQPSQTAEAVAKGLQGTIEFRKTCTVAKFNEADKAKLFVTWLKERNYRNIDTGAGLCIAYSAPQTLTQRKA